MSNHLLRGHSHALGAVASCTVVLPPERGVHHSRNSTQPHLLRVVRPQGIGAIHEWF